MHRNTILFLYQLVEFHNCTNIKHNNAIHGIATNGKAAKKASKAKAPKTDKKRKRRRKESYSIYIYKVLRQVHPDTGISSNAMLIMNSFINDIFDRIADESSRLEKHDHISRNADCCSSSFAWRLESWPSMQ